MNTVQLNVEVSEVSAASEVTEVTAASEVTEVSAAIAKVAKNVAYNPEQLAILLEGYAQGMTVEALAIKLSKNVKSVVARLSRAKVYVKKEKLNKLGVVSVRKGTIADDIGDYLGLSESLITSLEKTNKQALAAIWDALRPVDSQAK